MYACSTNDKSEPLIDWHASALNRSCLGTAIMVEAHEGE
jgi:hypothetical protein